MSRQRKPQKPRRLFRNREHAGVVAPARGQRRASGMSKCRGIGVAHFEAGRLAEAEAGFRRVVAIAGEKTPALGAAHAWLGRLAAVREDLSGRSIVTGSPVSISRMCPNFATNAASS